jgi:hypothetical protein
LISGILIESWNAVVWLFGAICVNATDRYWSVSALLMPCPSVGTDNIGREETEKDVNFTSLIWQTILYVCHNKAVLCLFPSIDLFPYPRAIPVEQSLVLHEPVTQAEKPRGWNRKTMKHGLSSSFPPFWNLSS